MYKKLMKLLEIVYLIAFGTLLILNGRKGLALLTNAQAKEPYCADEPSAETNFCAHNDKQVAPEPVIALREREKRTLPAVSCATQESADELIPEGGRGPEVPWEVLQQSAFPEEEIQVLERIVEAEAGGEDFDGKLLVANVVLNRVRDDAFPDTISEVVFQKSNGVTQFSPVANGRYDSVTVSRESREAVEKALEGEDISEGALYFAARKIANPKSMRWFDENLTLLFQHGGHEFFK